MIKWTIRIFLILVVIIVFTLFYLSFYGLKTDYFNSTIQNKVKIINPNFDLEFQKTNILLDLKKLELKVKVTKPKINFNNTSTDLSKLNLNISVKSFLKNEFALQHGEVGLSKIDIKQLIELANQVKASPFLFLAKEVFEKGQIEGNIKMNFDNTGRVKDDYKIEGSIYNFNAKILKKFNVNQTDARFKLDLIIDQLAAKEMSVARFYMKTEKWIPALNRLKVVVDQYDRTVFVEEALHRLVEIYYRLGLEDEAKQAASILGYNYQSGDWYKRSYKVFNKKYKSKRIKKKKEGGLIRRKIKSLFE